MLHRSIYRTPAYHSVAGAWHNATLLACSGGIDSTALLILAAAARSRGEVGPFIIVHVDHLTRPEIASERTFVSALSQKLHCSFVSLRIHRPVDESRGDVEAALRTQRYRTLAQACHVLQVADVTTAHQRDDQVETILMRLFTGAASPGLTGMKRISTLDTLSGPVTIRRPLLDVKRVSLEEILRFAGVEAMEDPSNLDVRYRRNALRHQIVPIIRQTFPGFGDALVRGVELAARDATYLDDEVSSMWHQFVSKDECETQVDRAFVRQAPAALTGRVLRHVALRSMTGSKRELSFERIEAVRQAANGRTGAVIQLPGGVDAYIDHDVIRFRSRMDTADEKQ